jgi:hypothetical protein
LSVRGAERSTPPIRSANSKRAWLPTCVLTAARYPNDQRLKQLIRELAVQSPRFEKLWESVASVPYQDFGRHKVIDHPDVGHITLDCDTLVVAANDLRIMVYTAEPDTDDAERLSLAVVFGTQSLVE